MSHIAQKAACSDFNRSICCLSSIFFIFALLLPEQVIQRFPKCPAYADAQLQGWIEFSRLNHSYGLPGHSYGVSQLLLGKIFFDTCNFHSFVFHQPASFFRCYCSFSSPALCSCFPYILVKINGTNKIQFKIRRISTSLHAITCPLMTSALPAITATRLLFR